MNNTMETFKLHDQHIHTSYSRDSQADIYAYAKIANEMGCKYFITTDHIEFDSVYNRQDWTVDYINLQKDLINLSNIYPHITFLLGIELGYRKDKINNMQDILKKYPFDLVNMSIHDNGIYDYYQKEDYIKETPNKMLHIYFNNMLDGVTNFDDFDVLSHLDYGFKTAYLIDNTIMLQDYETYLIEIFKIIIKKQKTLEVNIKVQDTLKTTIFLTYWLKLYYQLGGRKLTLSSDSHRVDFYMHEYQYYMDIIKQAGFNELRYFIKRKEYIYKI